MNDYSYRFFKRRYQHLTKEKKDKVLLLLREMDHSLGYDLSNIDIESTLHNLRPTYTSSDFTLLLALFEYFYPTQTEQDDLENMKEFRKNFTTDNNIPWGLILAKLHLYGLRRKVPKPKKRELKLPPEEQLRIKNERRKIEKRNEDLNNFKANIKDIQNRIDTSFRFVLSRNSHGSHYLKMLLFFFNSTPHDFIMNSDFFITRKNDLHWLYASLDETNQIVIHRLMDIL